MTLEVVDKIDEIVALNVYMRLEDLNMKQKTLALLAGISPAHLNKLIKGKKPISKATSLAKIAEVLHVDEAVLYQDSKIMAIKEAEIIGAGHALSDMKRLYKTVSDKLIDAMATIRELRAASPPEITPNVEPPIRAMLQSIWQAFPGAPTEVQTLCLFLLYPKRTDYLSLLKPRQRAKVLAAVRLLGLALPKEIS